MRVRAAAAETSSAGLFPKGRNKGGWTIKITSPAFEHQGGMPEKFTCQGRDVNPELRSENIPVGAESLALALDEKLGLDEGRTRAEVENAVKGHVIGSCELMGKYGKASASA